MLEILPLLGAGLALGWLINYLSDVLPQSRRLSRPACTHCGEPQNLLRYYLWPRRCPECGHRHARLLRTVAVDLLAAGGSIWLGLAPPDKLGFAGGLLLLGYFLLVVVIDIEHRLILHEVSYAGAALALLAGIALHGLRSTLIGGAVGFLVMLVLYKFGELFVKVVSRARGEPVDEVALGFGDVNLAGVLGLVLGWPVNLVGLVLAVLAGGIFSLAYMILRAIFGRYQSFEAIPYAPYLVVAAAFILFFPNAARGVLVTMFPLIQGGL